MNIRYTTPSGRLSFEVQVTTPKQAFEEIAGIQEIFDEAACGCCKSPAIRFEVREFDGNKYFKMCCTACQAQLDFGQNKDTVHLFPKRRDEDKRPLPNGGWYVYQGNDVPSPQQKTQDARPAPVLDADVPRLEQRLKLCSSRTQYDMIIGDIVAGVKSGIISQAGRNHLRPICEAASAKFPPAGRK